MRPSHFLFTVFVTSTLLTTGRSVADPPAHAEWTPIPELTDEFEGAELDASKWHDHNPGWKGRQPGYFSKKNVIVKDGALHLTARAEDLPGLPDGYHTFTTAAVKSRALVRYGYFEIRCRPMDSRASSAFWFYRSEPHLWTEIDVFEIGGAAPGHERTLHMNVHVFRTPEENRHWSKAGTWQAPFRLADEDHVYALEWNEKEILYSVDGKVVRTIENTHWHQPLHMNFDSETMPDWFGLPEKEKLPATFSIDYVRSWRRVPEPIGEPGSYAVYRYRSEGAPPASVVEEVEVSLGETEKLGGKSYQWYGLRARKANGEVFRLWLLVDRFPPEGLQDAQKATARYILQEGDREPLEYVDEFTGKAVLPRLGLWASQIPRGTGDRGEEVAFAPAVQYLGLRLERVERGRREALAVPAAARLELPVDLEIGTRYSVRDRREKRRFDNGAVELVSFEPADYPERLEAGQTIFNVPQGHENLVARRPVFYMGVGGEALTYPETLYRSNYLGLHTDYLDEPAARTCFQQLRRELENNRELQRTISPQYALETFKRVFHEANYEGRPTWLIEGLRKRRDVEIGDLPTLQANVWSWEVPIETGAYQLLSAPDGPPAAIVYEGRLATGRDLPLIDSLAEIQIPTNDPKALLDMYYGMLRGAARVSGKKWGVSIYGQFAVGEIPFALRYAYDLGASYFLFWTSDHGHHVPYLEQLALSRFIGDYAHAHPDRDLEALRRAAEVIILFPAGYSFIGERMWWTPALNLERENQRGVKYRLVLHRLGMEIERCYRLGIAYDLAWDLEGLDLSGYREVISVREDGTVHVSKGGSVEVFSESRPVPRPDGEGPTIEVTLSPAEGTAPLSITAAATIQEGSAPIYFTPFRDETGVWRNRRILWELWGPEEWHYRSFHGRGDPKSSSLTLELKEPGTYRLRSSVVDRSGRFAVTWNEIRVN